MVAAHPTFASFSRGLDMDASIPSPALGAVGVVYFLVLCTIKGVPAERAGRPML
jgi:hypothetical protein